MQSLHLQSKQQCANTYFQSLGKRKDSRRFPLSAQFERINDALIIIKTDTKKKRKRNSDRWNEQNTRTLMGCGLFGHLKGETKANQ